MKAGPDTAKKRPGSYLPPRRRAPVCSPDMPLPDGVRVERSVTGDKHHAFLQNDGQWYPCGGRGRCRECNREEAAKSIERRTREALERAFCIPADSAFMLHRVSASTFIEGLIAIETEFSIRFNDEELGDGDLSLNDLVALVESALAR